MANTIQAAMADAGLHPHKPIDIAANGKVVRFRLEGDKAGSKNGWAVLNSGDGFFGAFGSWKSGASHTWHETTAKPQTPAERAAMAQRIAALRQAQALEQQAVHADTSTKAKRLWATARPANDSHQYLRRKEVNAYGIRQLRDTLLVPLRDVSGVLWSLQFISPDGTKRFLTGGKVSGCYCPIGKPVERILLAEGLATGSTLHQATKAAVAVCFSAGNLLAVARAMREKFPHLKIILCADNDSSTPGNPGLTKATEAARAVGGFLAVPHLKAGQP